MSNRAFRTHMSNAIGRGMVGESVTVSGWIHRWRDHGGLIFLDIRDGEGVVQVVCDPATNEAVHRSAQGLRAEFVVRASGVVRERPEANPNIPTGEIEIDVRELTVFNECPPLPFQIDDSAPARDDLRLEYRFLDLRRPVMRRVMVLRHAVSQAIRTALNSRKFLEIETPILMKSTPEGARDFLVPSRVHPGSFYALPQSPQLYKQMLMISGMERYYQLARCFRDEDLRADRQPEFTQLDLEMSFVEQDDVFQVIEGTMAETLRETRGIELETPFLRLSYDESMARFGVDKPDLRFGLELAEISDIAAQCGFGVFKGAVEAGGIVKAIRLPHGAERSRREIENLEKIARVYGAKGLAWLKLTPDGASGGISKFLEAGEVSTIAERTEAVTGDALLFVADRPSVVNAALGNLRNHIAQEQGLVRRDQYKFAWITDFPLFEQDEETGNWSAAHHMFTMPYEEHLEHLESDPGRVKAQLYDLVLNGWELGSGSIRVHRADIQRRIMGVVGMSEEEAQRRFGFLLKALDYGAPPHGGIALGLDRVVTLFSEDEVPMRDVIPFAKTTSMTSLMDESPSPVDQEQLDELGLRVVEVPAPEPD